MTEMNHQAKSSETQEPRASSAPLDLHIAALNSRDTARSELSTLHLELLQTCYLAFKEAPELSNRACYSHSIEESSVDGFSARTTFTGYGQEKHSAVFEVLSFIKDQRSSLTNDVYDSYEATSFKGIGFECKIGRVVIGHQKAVVREVEWQAMVPYATEPIPAKPYAHYTPALIAAEAKSISSDSITHIAFYPHEDCDLKEFEFDLAKEDSDVVMWAKQAHENLLHYWQVFGELELEEQRRELEENTRLRTLADASALEEEASELTSEAKKVSRWIEKSN